LALGIGMSLTESLAMMPASSVSGFYLAHPQSRYFNVGRIGDDQVQAQMKRRALSRNDIERIFAANLS
jgi:5-methyltetrahydrofolate--homocysteine methyltransferase